MRSLVHDAPVADATEEVNGELRDERSLDEACRGVDVVVHLAARYGGSADDMVQVNVTGTELLARAAVAAGVIRFVFVSSAAVYGSGPFHRVKEDCERIPDEPYGESKLAAECAARQVLGDRLTVLRPCMVYVSGPCPLLNQLSAALRSIPFPRVDGLDPPIDLVHRDDVASAVVAAASDRGAGGVFNLAGAPPVDYVELGESAARALGLSLTWTPAAAPGGATSDGLARPDSFPRELYSACAIERTICIDRARAELGYNPTRGTLHEIVASLEAMR